MQKKLSRPRHPRVKCLIQTCDNLVKHTRDRYCSRACYYESRTGHPPTNPKRRYMMKCQNIECLNGGEFEAGGRTGKDRDSKFCSVDCMEGMTKYGRKCNLLSDVDAAYLAGIMDGEGTIMIYKRGRAAAGMRITVANTFRPLLEWVVVATGCGSIVTKPGNEKHKPGHTWQCNSQAALSVL